MKAAQLTSVFRTDVRERLLDFGVAAATAAWRRWRCRILSADLRLRPGFWLCVDKRCVKMPLFLAVYYMRLCSRVFTAFERRQLECYSAGRSMCKNIVVSFLLDFFFFTLFYFGFSWLRLGSVENEPVRG